MNYGYENLNGDPKLHLMTTMSMIDIASSFTIKLQIKLI